MSFRIRRIMATIACALPTTTIATSCALAEDIQVTVTVATSDGQPIADAPVIVHTLADIDFGFTDSTGRLVVTTTLAEESREVVARIWDGAYMNLPTWEEQEHAREREELLKREYFTATTNAAQAPENQAALAIQILLYPAMTVRGRFVDVEGVPLRKWSVSVRGGAAGVVAWPNEIEGPFALGGVKRGAAAELWANTESSQFHVYALSAEQTQTDIDLGDIPLVDADSPVQSDLQLTNIDHLLGPGELPWYRSVTAISSDRSIIYSFDIGFDGKAVETRTALPEDGVGGRLAPGTYYIAPGLFGSALHWSLLDAIRDGRQAELDAAGVPKITAVEGEIVTATVDMRAARDAILSVIEP